MKITEEIYKQVKSGGDIPQELIDHLKEKKKQLQWYRNDSWNISLLNDKHNRYFLCRRRNGFKADVRFTSSLDCYWEVYYGEVQWKFTKNVIGDLEVVWFRGKRFNRKKNPDGTIVEIPNMVTTKKEALQLAKELGFNIK